MVGSTGTATIVFTDLVGSTALRSSLGERAADELRREHDRVLAAVVAAHHGRVVKGSGDGLLAAFDAASDAVAAAVAMQQAVHTLARRRGLDLRIRVGISAGDVTWDDGDCFGLPVVEAARLEAATGPGRIWCAEIVKVLARGRAPVEYVPVGEQRLKDLDEPVVVWEVAWSPPEPTAAGWPCVGRDRELATLWAAWERARGGAGSTVLVAGEPGIGKTRLLTETVERIKAAGGVVLWGAAYEGEGRAYGPVSEMVDGHLASTDPAIVAVQLGALAGLVARVAPRVAEVVAVVEPPPVPVEMERDRTVDAVVEFVASTARSAPMVVVVDDAHWADTATVGFLRVLVRRAEKLPMLVVIAYREVDLDRRHPLADALAGWRRDPHVQRLALSGLDADAVRELLTDAAGQDDIPVDLVRAITTETGGNPFFVREVVLHLVEEGHIRREDGRWVADPVAEVGIPEGVREVIGRRLSRLSDPTNRLLAVASAFDTDFDLADVATVAGLGDGDALDAVDEALTAVILRPGDGFDRYGFTHALFRHTLWGEVNPSRQVRLHRAIAEQIEQRSNHQPTAEQAVVLARHYRHSAALPGAERGVPYAVMAADQAAARHAPVEELDALTIALELLPAGDERHVALRERAARAAILATSWDAALDHARVVIDHRAQTEGPAAACRHAVDIGRLADLVEVNAGWPFGHLVDRWRQALDGSGEVAVQLLAWQVAEAEFLDPDNPGIPVDSPERRRMNDLAGRLPAPQRPGGMTGYCHPSAAALFDDFRAGNSAAPLLFAGAYRESITGLRMLADLVAGAGMHAASLFWLAMLGRLHLLVGELDRAADVQAQGELLLDRVDPESNAVGQFDCIRLFRSQLVEDDPAPVLAWLEDLAPRYARSDLRWVSGSSRMWAAAMRAQLGDHRDALADLARNLAVVERSFPGAINYPFVVHNAAATLWAANAMRHADVIERNLHEKVLDPDFCYPESDARWSAALLCAVTDRADEARRWFQQAHDRLTAQEAILLLPHVCCDEALMEIRLGPAGDRAHGLARLDEARRWVDHIGLPKLLPRIDALRDQIKQRPPLRIP